MGIAQQRAAASDGQPRPLSPLDPDIAKAIAKVKERDEIYASLPKIDCGACGSPTCMAFAEDVVKGYAEFSECVGRGRGAGGPLAGPGSAEKQTPGGAPRRPVLRDGRSTARGRKQGPKRSARPRELDRPDSRAYTRFPSRGLALRLMR